MKTEWNPIKVMWEIKNYFIWKKSDKNFHVLISTKETKEMKTRQQEKTYYKILTWISKHLWYKLQEVKIYVLSWCFWTHRLKLFDEEIEVPNISETRWFSKEQAIFFIDTLLQFVKDKNIPVEITPKEVQSLYDSYNN